MHVPTDGFEWLQAVIALVVGIPLLIILIGAAYYFLVGTYELRAWSRKVRGEALTNLWRNVWQRSMLEKPDGHSRRK